MVLSDIDILKLIKTRKLVIDPKPKYRDIKCTHLDLHLSNKLYRYKNKVLNLKDNSSFILNEIKLSKKGYKINPNGFFLGSTIEKVTIPNGYFGFIETKGNIARAGIQAHNADGHIDPGFSGNITLEIKNNSNRQIIIYPEIAFVQLYIFKVSSKSLNPYNGKYQNQKGAIPYKRD